MIVEQVLLISAVVSGGSMIMAGGSMMIVGGFNLMKNNFMKVNLDTNFQWKPYKYKSCTVNLDDLDAEDIYNEPFMYKHDLSNICVEPLVPEKT